MQKYMSENLLVITYQYDEDWRIEKYKSQLLKGYRLRVGLTILFIRIEIIHRFQQQVNHSSFEQLAKGFCVRLMCFFFCFVALEKEYVQL